MAKLRCQKADQGFSGAEVEEGTKKLWGAMEIFYDPLCW
jgi:hypothetical protein